MDMYPTIHGRLHAGRFAPESSYTEQSDAITELLAAAGTAIIKDRGKIALLPHLFVIRSEKPQKVAIGEATWHEYIAALCNMSKVVEVPVAWACSRYVSEALRRNVGCLPTLKAVLPRKWLPPWEATICN